MSSLYEQPSATEPGELLLLRRIAEITAAQASVLSDDITDLADLVRAGLTVNTGRGRTAVDAYEEAALVLGLHLKDYLTAGGTVRVPVAVPSLDDVLTVLGTEHGDEFGRVEVGLWLLWLEMWLRSWGAGVRHQIQQPFTVEDQEP